MSITAYRENLAQESSFFYTNTLPTTHIFKQRALHKLHSFQLAITAQEKNGNSCQKQEKQRLHNSNGKITRGALEQLRNEAIAYRKKMALKSTSDLCCLVAQRSSPKKQETISSLAQQQKSIAKKAFHPSTTSLKKHPSSTKTISTMTSLENSKHDSETTCGESSIKQKKQFKILQLGSKRQIFEIVRYLDSGSFGEVHLVRHMTTGMLLCLKSMRKAQFIPESLTQLAREIKIQSFLNHPNIIKVYGCTSDEKNIYILMEPCLGKNLYKLMAGGAIEEAEARGYIQQVCQAVAYLHGQNIIHRDIKPENVLIDRGTAKLCDFGWAVYSPLMRGTHCGTPLYTPPEMIRNEFYDTKVDVWCIGVMTYELLYGVIPFDIHDQEELSRIATDTIQFPPSPNVSAEAEEFMRGCLVKLGQQRMSIRQALDHDFMLKKKLQFRHTFP